MKNIFENYVWSPIKLKLNLQKFNHLDYVGQTYTEHFSDSMSYSWSSLKSSFYFFCHGFYPSVFETNGSDTICAVYSRIQDKYNEIQDRYNTL